MKSLLLLSLSDCSHPFFILLTILPSRQESILSLASNTLLKLFRAQCWEESGMSVSAHAYWLA